MFLTACPAEAASLMPEYTNAGVTVFITEVASVRGGLRYAGIVELLSACPIVCCCSHRFLFPFRGVLVPVLHLVRSFASPYHHMSMLTAFDHVSHVDIFLSQVVILPNARSPRRRCLFGCDHGILRWT